MTTTILAIGAHPDDVEWGAGGILQRFARRRALVLSRGEGGVSREGIVSCSRASEAQDAAKVLEMEARICGLRDTAIDLTHAARCIEDDLEIHRPDVVVTHSPVDVHQDHATVARATLIACRDRPVTILAYMTPSTDLAFAPNWFVQLTEAELDRKVEAIRCHRSQAGREYMNPDRVRDAARYWAMRVRSPLPVEPFALVRCFAPPPVLSSSVGGAT